MRTAVVAVAAVMTWVGGVTHGLQADDMHLLRDFLRVQDALPSLYRYFFTLHWELQFRPLGAFLSDRLFGLFWPTVWPMRLVAFAIHAVGAIAVVRLGRILGIGTTAAAFAGLLFATLPAHAESVLWIATMHGTLENVLTLWAVVLLIESRRGQWRPWRTAAGLGLFFCAMTTKESGVVGIGLIALHDMVWRKELDPAARRPRALVAMYGSMLAGVGVFLALRAAAYDGFQIRSINTLDLGFLSSAALRVMCVSLSPIDWRGIEGPLVPYTRTMLGQIIVLLVAALPLAIAWRYRSRVVLFLWLAIGAALGPLATLAVVPAERHMYLATAFAGLLTGLLCARIAAGGVVRRRVVLLLATLWIATQVYVSQARRGAWHRAAAHVDAITTQTVQLVPNLDNETLLVYLGVPDHVYGAYVLRFGNMGDLIRAATGLPDLQAHMLCTPAELPAKLLDAPGALQFTIGARGGHLYWPDALHGGAYAEHDSRLLTSARLGQSFLVFDWLNAGKPAELLFYDQASRTLRLGTVDERADVATNLFTFIHWGAPPPADVQL